LTPPVAGHGECPADLEVGAGDRKGIAARCIRVPTAVGPAAAAQDGSGAPVASQDRPIGDGIEQTGIAII
jgi:hypothetical protein